MAAERRASMFKAQALAITGIRNYFRHWQGREAAGDCVQAAGHHE